MRLHKPFSFKVTNPEKYTMQLHVASVVGLSKAGWKLFKEAMNLFPPFWIKVWVEVRFVSKTIVSIAATEMASTSTSSVTKFFFNYFC